MGNGNVVAASAVRVGSAPYTDKNGVTRTAARVFVNGEQIRKLSWQGAMQISELIALAALDPERGKKLAGAMQALCTKQMGRTNGTREEELQDAFEV